MTDHSRAPFLSYAANVTNTGAVIIDTCALLFLNFSQPDHPLQRLIGYAHLRDLQPGRTGWSTSTCLCRPSCPAGDRWLQPASIGSSSYTRAKRRMS